jgi:Family of unknown function (DUF5683)
MQRTTRSLGILILVLIPILATAQEPSPPDSVRTPPAGEVADTSRGYRFLGADSVSAPHPESKSTTTAVLLSAVLPGAGQFYNGSYWKVPVFASLGIYFGYQFFYNNGKYQDYKDLYAASQPSLTGGNQLYYNLREFYRQERDRFGWYFLLLYIVNLVDAYVDASLSEFEISDDVALELMPRTAGQVPTAMSFGLRITF